MRTTPRFVTPDDYFNYTGKSLNAELQLESNTSNVANIFLMQIEDKILARIDSMSFRTTPWNRLTPFQTECLQKAIIVEAEYIIRNSDLFTDSGYDPEKGEIISMQKLQNIEICRSSIDFLKNCGLYNHVIKNRRRYLEVLSSGPNSFQIVNGPEDSNNN